MSIEIQVKDAGVQFIIQVLDLYGSVVNIGAATALQVLFLRPDQSLLAVSANLYSNGVDGKIQYVSVAGDLGQTGRWGIQAAYQIGGNQKYTSIKYFNVDANLPGV
jgi:hypothetical protein